MKNLEIRNKCWQCRGEGIAVLPGEEGDIIIDPCNVCGGDGYIEIQSFLLVEQVFTYEIVEATVISEFNALTKAQKQTYRDIISLGVCSLAEGTKIRTALMNMFGAGTTTRANLAELVGE